MKLNNEIIGQIMHCLQDVHCQNVDAYNVSSIYDYVDYCVIATVHSEVHRRGVVEALAKFFVEKSLESYAKICQTKIKSQRQNVGGWFLIDIYEAIIHLMTEEMREFYNLEKLWFSAHQLAPV